MAWSCPHPAVHLYLVRIPRRLRPDHRRAGSRTPPDVIKEAAKAALDANDTHYPPGNGYPYALEAISNFEAEAHGLHYAPSEIILTVGATEALFASFSTILNPGDEVIIPTPAFGLYEALVQLQGGVPVSCPQSTTTSRSCRRN